MRISIVTPCFNSAATLERTLESIHSQTGDFELEHIVIDGGSTDGTVEILQRWSDRLSFVSEPDKGQSDALNKGFGKATGDILAWLNADDLYLPGALGTVADCFRRNPATKWLYGRCIIIDEQGKEIRKAVTAYKNLLLRNFSHGKLLLENFISQPATFFHKDLFDELGPVDISLNYTMDYDLWLRFAQVAKPMVIDDYLAAFLFNDTTKTGGAFEESLREANEVSRKYAKLAGKAWIGSLNYWFYYKRTALIYRMMQ